MGKIKKTKIKSIKRSFIWYLPICAVIAYLGTYGIGILTNELQFWYMVNYSEAEYNEQTEEVGELHDTAMYIQYEIIKTKNGITYSYDAPYIGRFVSKNTWRRFVYGVISSAQIILIPAWVLGCVGITAVMFYKKELEKPIKVLKDASDKISDNCLEFEMEPVKQNELGQLCRSFEDMRQALYENNKEMWHMLEERKRLNAAFSHDIRTPLAVLKGYQEMLRNYAPEGKFSEEQLIEMIDTMGNQVERLESYTQKMSALQKLEDVDPNVAAVDLKKFAKQCQETGKMLAGELEFEFCTEVEGLDTLDTASMPMLYIDPELVMEVYENLISNAVRFAKSMIMVTLDYKEKDRVLSFVVEDDGPGFSEEALQRGTDPFYGSEKEGCVHFGLGLYICKTICRKHGGDIKTENRILDGTVVGSRVVASFAG